ncbi:DNA-directed RNA polymerase [Blastocladiella emersonii ATCC 22665]|nr:DNA-directed RNA polymerase [Blastocladiella emersonii ATCC 22665]
MLARLIGARRVDRAALLLGSRRPLLPHVPAAAVSRRFESTATATVAPPSPAAASPMPDAATIAAAIEASKAPSAASQLPPSPLAATTLLDPIILPPLLPTGSRVKQAGHPYSLMALQEYLAVLYALVQGGDMDRAERIYVQLVSRNPAEMRQIMDANVYNIFVEGWMERVRTHPDDPNHPAPIVNKAAAKKGLEWFLSMRKANVEPDASSFALLLRGLLRAEELTLAVLYLSEARSVGPTTSELAEAKRRELAAKRKAAKATTTTATATKAGAATSSVLNATRTDAFVRERFDQILTHPYLNGDLDADLAPAWQSVLSIAGLQPLSTAVDKHADPDAVFASESTLAEVLRAEQESNRAASAAAASKTTHSVDDVKRELAEVQQARREVKLYADQIQLPAAKPVDSLGLSLLQSNLKVMRDNVGDGQFSKYALQLKLEDESYNVALERLKSENEQESSMPLIRSGALKEYMWDWHKTLVYKIARELKACAAIEPVTTNYHDARNERELYGPLLAQLSPDKLAMITIVEVLRMHVPMSADPEDGDVGELTKINKVVTAIGSAVEAEINAEALRKRMRAAQATGGNADGVATSLSERDLMAKYLDDKLFTNQRVFNMTVRRLYAKLQNQQLELGGDNIDESKTPDGLSSGLWLKRWPISSRAKVGSVLLSMLMESAHVTRFATDPVTGVQTTKRVPAFYHTYAFAKGKKIGVVKYHQQISELLSSDPVKNTLHPKMLPMVVRPRPWLTYMSGGYLTSRSPCMRLKDNNPEQLAYLRASAKNNRLNYILASLDVLGSTAWRINEDVFKTVLEVWNSGEETADIPPALNEEIKMKLAPKKPADYDTNPMARREYAKKATDFQTFVRNAYSLRCDTNYKVEVARTFLGQEMYFPHNMDFRGRAYPMPVHLNHMSSDLCRGLMTFAEAKPLGERGWFWLKVHMASLHGYDKQSFAAREAWVMDNLDNILDAADHPLTGKRWWLKADEPWQCLATCIEIARAHRSGDPTTYKCALPIHQDGTCNGLQHYAALGGDLMGAQQVNLVRGDRPADVYTAVANQVAALVAKDAEKGNKYAQMINGRITRKIVKQTVMTNVYGVTFVGARQQIQNRLNELKEFSDDDVYQLAAYIAKKVFLSIGKIFHGAQKIQDWLNDVARLVSKSIPRVYADKSPASMTSVVWTTPLGLTCVQPYRKEVRTQVKTILQTINLADPNNPAPVNVMKQRSAFPPNFIHSLDASHMMMTAIACHHRGLTFASVHDSYWTHACDVDTMNGIIRDEFVTLHSQPIMDNLVKEFQLRYKDHIVPVTALKADAAEAEDASEAAAAADEDAAAAAPAPKKKATKTRAKAIPLTTEAIDAGQWVQLDLPPLPPRGDFDVRNVKDSAYFFH